MSVMNKSNAEARAWAFNLIRNAGSELVIDVYDVVGEGWWGEGTSARDVRNLLKDFDGKRVAVRINSLGGDVFDGVAIYNLLRDASRRGIAIHVDIDGIAASAASIIACAGDTVAIAKNAMVMIHNAWTFAMGNAEELQKTVEMLDKVDGQLAVTYLETVKRFGKTTTAKQIREAMDAETWLTADEALEFGIVSEVTKASKAAAMVQAMASVGLLPEELRTKWAAKGADGAVAVVGRRLAESLAAMSSGQGDGSHVVNIHVNAGEGFDAAAAAIERFTTPAQSGSTSEEDEMGLKELITALGAKDEAEALKLANEARPELEKAHALVGFVNSVHELVGAQGDAALGILNAWKGNSEKMPALVAASKGIVALAQLIMPADKVKDATVDDMIAVVTEGQTAKAEAERKSLLDAIKAAGKATAHEVETLLKDQAIPFLKSWLAEASPRVPGAGDSKTVTEPKKDTTLSAEDRAFCQRHGYDEQAFAEERAQQRADKLDEKRDRKDADDEG